MKDCLWGFLLLAFVRLQLPLPPQFESLVRVNEALKTFHTCHPK